MKWMVNATPRPLYLRDDPVPIVQETGWAPGPVWTGAENLAPTGIRSPDRPACIFVYALINIFCFDETLASFDGDVGRNVCRSHVQCPLPLVRLLGTLFYDHPIYWHSGCKISGYRRDIDVFALLGCYTSYVDHSLPKFRDRVSVRSSRVLGLTLEMEPIVCFQTSVTNCQKSLRNDSEEWRSSGYISRRDVWTDVAKMIDGFLQLYLPKCHRKC